RRRYSPWWRRASASATSAGSCPSPTTPSRPTSTAFIVSLPCTLAGRLSMKRRVWASSRCRGAIAVLLVALWPGAFAEPLRVAAFEYFPGHLSAEPPPLEAVGPEQSTGLVFAPDSRPGDARWLRGRFELDASPQNVHALYISAANRGVRAFVNGVEVGSTSLSDAERFGWNYPLFFSIPPSLLHAGSNTLDLRLGLTSRGWGSLRDARLGPHDALKPL